jgi:ribosomal protein S27AE|tara:strand:- start:16 stop:360 length:345 start_codon:yes stop_codon:yes gene_type:complete
MLMVRKNKPVKDGRIRSFNLSTDAIKKMERGAEIEGLSRSGYIERLIITNDHSRRVKKDIGDGLQTVLEVGITPEKPFISKNQMCKHCPSFLADHLRFEDGKWTVECPNKKVAA